MKISIFILPIIILFSSAAFGQWTKKEFVDDFGDPTGESYITSNITNGTFSNSATYKSTLTGRIVVTDYGLYFTLFEYGSNSNSPVLIGNWKVKFKAPNGDIFDTSFEYDGTLTGRKLAVLAEWLKRYSNIKVYTEEYRGSSTYNFVINCNGFTKASNGMEFPEYK